MLFDASEKLYCNTVRCIGLAASRKCFTVWQFTDPEARARPRHEGRAAEELVAYSSGLFLGYIISCQM